MIPPQLRTAPGWFTDMTAILLRPERLMWVLHALCCGGLVMAPLVKQGNYLVDASTLYAYWATGIANLAPQAAGAIGLSAGLAGCLGIRSPSLTAARDVGVLAGLLLLTLTYFQAREHVLSFGSMCVSGGGIVPDPLAPILPMPLWWGALLTHVVLAAVTWFAPDSTVRGMSQEAGAHQVRRSAP